jgi:hypothetical protein
MGYMERGFPYLPFAAVDDTAQLDFSVAKAAAELKKYVDLRGGHA